jgi:hypothetical protein
MEFPDVWTNTDFVNVPEDEWMRIPMKDDWEDRLRKSSKQRCRYHQSSEMNAKMPFYSRRVGGGDNGVLHCLFERFGTFICGKRNTELR